MERFLTVLVTALCGAPLVFILTIRWLLPLIKNWFPASSGMEFSTSLSVGVGIAFVSFLLIGGLAWFFAGHGYLRPVQMITGLMLAGWSLAWAVFAWNEPRQLDYHDKRAILEAEIRIDKALLKGRPVNEAVALSYTGGDFDSFHLDKIREEGGFIILPWEITVHTVYRWAIWSTVSYVRSYFPLNLPYRPSQSTEWSNWEAPSPFEGCATPAGLTLRYRFRLVSIHSPLP